jgi:hypothetical protein
MSCEPTWDTPGKLNGLPVTNWKRRTGYSMSGTVEQLIQRWLWLPYNIQQECSLGWGPNAAGQHGAMGGSEIGSYVRRNGLPPVMAAARARPATREEIEAMFAEPVCGDWPPRPRGHSTSDRDGSQK